VSPPQGGRGGPLHAGLLQDPSQLSSAFAGSFGGGGSNGFGSPARQQQMPDWRLPADFDLMPSGAQGARAPSLDRPLSGAGPVPSGWGCFGAGSLSTTGAFATPHSCKMHVRAVATVTVQTSEALFWPDAEHPTTHLRRCEWVVAAPAADGRQPAPRRASMRVDLAASDTADLLPRMGCPVCLRLKEWPAPP
jgi:hypothetical protein